jgi:hypothetical protein
MNKIKDHTDADYDDEDDDDDKYNEYDDIAFHIDT